MTDDSDNPLAATNMASGRDVFSSMPNELLRNITDNLPLEEVLKIRMLSREINSFVCATLKDDGLRVYVTPTAKSLQRFQAICASPAIASGSLKDAVGEIAYLQAYMPVRQLLDYDAGKSLITRYRDTVEQASLPAPQEAMINTAFHIFRKLVQEAVQVKPNRCGRRRVEVEGILGDHEASDWAPKPLKWERLAAMPGSSTSLPVMTTSPLDVKDVLASCFSKLPNLTKAIMVDTIDSPGLNPDALYFSKSYEGRICKLERMSAYQKSIYEFALAVARLKMEQGGVHSVFLEALSESAESLRELEFDQLLEWQIEPMQEGATLHCGTAESLKALIPRVTTMKIHTKPEKTVNGSSIARFDLAENASWCNALPAATNLRILETRIDSAVSSLHGTSPFPSRGQMPAVADLIQAALHIRFPKLDTLRILSTRISPVPVSAVWLQCCFLLHSRHLKHVHLDGIRIQDEPGKYISSESVKKTLGGTLKVLRAIETFKLVLHVGEENGFNKAEIAKLAEELKVELKGESYDFGEFVMRKALLARVYGGGKFVASKELLASVRKELLAKYYGRK